MNQDQPPKLRLAPVFVRLPMETGAILVSYDSHFKEVDGLRLWI